MNYPVSTSTQLQAVLRALRKSRGLSQAQLGQLLGVNQKRAARIEGHPGVTSFDQVARLVAALGGRLSIQDLSATTPTPPAVKARGTKKTAPLNSGAW